LEHQGQIWRVTVKWILKEIRWKSVEWINLLQDKDMRQVFINALINLWVTQNVGNFLTISKTIRRAVLRWNLLITDGNNFVNYAMYCYACGQKVCVYKQNLKFNEHCFNISFRTFT
jgi:hypothetical protein